MMTEEEAKKKWCPMAYRDVDGEQMLCNASACMMWREDLTREEAENGYQAKNGHCGLA